MKRTVDVLVSLIITAMVMAASVIATGAQEATPVSVAADLEAATAWLIDQQGEDGGFPGFSGESEPSITIDAVMALAAAEHRGIDTSDAIDEAVGYLQSGDVALVFAQTGTGQAAKLVLGMVAAGEDPSDIAGVNPLALLEQGANPDTGVYGTGVYDHALVMLALAATGSDIPAEAITALEETRTPEGGWAFDGTVTEGAADTNTTSLVVQALVAAGQGDSALVSDALAYLLMGVDGTSGATFQPGAGFPADASSTAFVTQAVIAVGDDPSSDAWGNLTAALGAFQAGSGAFFFNSEDTAENLFSTVQVIPAVAGLALPIVPADGQATPVATPVTLQPNTLVARAA